MGGSITGDTKRQHPVLSHVEVSQAPLLVAHVDHSKLVGSQGLADGGKEWNTFRGDSFWIGESS